MYDWSGAALENATAALFKHLEKTVQAKYPELCQNKKSRMSRLYKIKCAAYRNSHRANTDADADVDADTKSGCFSKKPPRIYAVQGLKTCLCGHSHQIGSQSRDRNSALSAEYMRFFVHMPPQPTAEANVYTNLGLPLVYRLAMGSDYADMVLDDYANLLGAKSSDTSTTTSSEGSRSADDKKPSGCAQTANTAGTKKTSVKGKAAGK